MQGMGMAQSTPRVEVQVFVENLQKQVRGTGLLPETRQQLQEAFDARDRADRQAQELEELGCLMDLANVVGRDLEDRIIRWTKGSEHLYGFTAQEALGRVSHELLRTQFPEPLEEIRRKLFEVGRWEGELVHRRANGESVVVASQWALRRDATDKPQSILEVNNPITEHKRIEESLRQKEAFVRQIIDASPNVVFVKDEAGRLIAVNQAMARLYGKPTEELVDHFNCERLSIPGDFQQYARVDQQVFRTLQPMTVEETHQCLDGRTLWFMTTKTPIRLPDGRMGILGVAVDITERRRDEEQHRQTAERLRTQIERMPIGCIINDRDFIVTGWNPAAERIFGYTAEEAIGKHPYDLYIPESARSVVDERRRRLALGDMDASGINENITKDGRTILCQWTNTPLFDERGEYAGRIAMVQDVTEQVHAQEALLQAKDAAEAGNRAKDQFLAMLSHELRTPLTPVVMLVASLEMDAGLPQSVRNDMTTIRRNIEVQAHLIDDLLDLGRFTSGKLSLQMRPADVHEQLRAVAGI